MELAVKPFFDYKPASQWAFEVDFSNPMLVSKKRTKDGHHYQLTSTNTFSEQELLRISQAVVSVTQPKFDIEPYTNCYGNFDFVVPIYDTNNIRLSITFEDTDDCLISYKFITSLLGGSIDSGVPAWLNVHETILITITEYDTYNYDIERPNTPQAQYHNINTTSYKSYFCKLVEYTEPNYNRTSEDAQATTVTLTFLAVPAYPTILDDRLIFTAGVEQIDVLSQAKEVIKMLKKVCKDIKFTVATALGYMDARDPKLEYTLKEIYDDMLKAFGGRIPKNLAELENWWKRHALSSSPNGQCSRGPNMLFQLVDYINSGRAAEESKEGYSGPYVQYKHAPAAYAFGFGTGTSEEFRSHIRQISSGGTQTLTYNEFTQQVQKLGKGQYITFTYKRKKEDGTWEDSKHIVFTTFEDTTNTYDKWWSDFLQKSAAGTGANTKDFKITGIYEVDNVNLLGGQENPEFKVEHAEQEPEQPATPVTPVTPFGEFPLM